MEFNEYQKLAARTAHYGEKDLQYKLMYVCMGLAGETGEVIEKLKKVIRNDDGVFTEEKRKGVASELGDTLWYLSQLAQLLDIPFEDVAQMNIAKLVDRQERGVLKSEGDNR
jgi:NTP pyrophosphatase (non-canonical NTP hydrolase)